MKKKVWPVFSGNVEQEKREGTIYEGPQGILTNTVKVLRSVL